MTVVIEDGVRGLMPEAAIEFLRGIVRGDDAIRVIRLAPVKLGFDSAQEIVCESRNGTARRRVFGFTPVSAELNVSRGEGKAVVRLAV